MAETIINPDKDNDLIEFVHDKHLGCLNAWIDIERLKMLSPDSIEFTLKREIIPNFKIIVRESSLRILVHKPNDKNFRELVDNTLAYLSKPNGHQNWVVTSMECEDKYFEYIKALVQAGMW